MSSLIHITNHAAQAAARLPEQYRNRPRLGGVLNALVDQVQDIEDALYPIIAARQLDDATGETLDLIGSYFNAPRNGLDDTDYRAVISGTIAVQNSDSTAETLLACAATIFGASAAFIRTPNSTGEAQVLPTAVLTLAVGSPTVSATVWSYLVGVLQQAIGAGITLDQLYVFNAAGTFSMDGPQSWTAGFDDGTGTVGGGFAQPLYQNPNS